MSTVELIPIDEAFNKINQIVASGDLDELLDLAPVGAAPEDIVTVLWSGPIDTYEQADGAVTAIHSADVLDYCFHNQENKHKEQTLADLLKTAFKGKQVKLMQINPESGQREELNIQGKNP